MKKLLTLPFNSALLILITSCISLVAFVYFYTHGQANLSYYDTIARLNTARKIIDSVTPGIGQLGGIWLPFPQLLMVPLIWNDYLYHTGIAGYLISGVCFVVGAVYLQKTIYLLTNNRKVAMLGWFLFVSNSNVLLLQTMAMSEVFYMCFFILTIYHLILWINHHRISNFLQIAFYTMILTLTRYEGYFVLFGVFLVIAIECFRTYTLRQKEKIEGMLLLFLSIAVFGIILWCIYSGLFYKDPLFWLHAYTPESTPILQSTTPVIDEIYGIKNPTLFQSLSIYSQVIFWTNGVFTVLLGILGMFLYFIRPTRKYFSLVLITVILFIFLVIGYFIGFIPHIEFPAVVLHGIKERPWSVYADNNIRYGIVLLPCIILFAAFAAAKNRIFFVIALLFAFEQVFFSFVSPQLFQYPFTRSWRYPMIKEVPWFLSHYDGGMVVIAASRHEDFIFQSHLPYKDFIYEGTREYWSDSLNHPSYYARWVIFDSGIVGDRLAEGLTQSGVNDLKTKYQLVYLKKGFHIYKLKAQYPVQRLDLVQ